MLLPISLLALTLSSIPIALATPTPIYRRSNCTNPTVRKEWRTLSRSEQINYVEAVNCLATKQSRIGLTTPLYDDFPYIHNQLNNESMCFSKSFRCFDWKISWTNYSPFSSFIFAVAQIFRARLWSSSQGVRVQGQCNVSFLHSDTSIYISVTTRYLFSIQILGLDSRLTLPIHILNLGCHSRLRWQRLPQRHRTRGIQPLELRRRWTI